LLHPVFKLQKPCLDLQDGAFLFGAFSFCNRIRRTALVNVCVYPATNLFGIHSTNTIIDHFAISENERMWNAPNAIVCSQFWARVNIDDDDLDRVRARTLIFLECRIGSDARRTPGRSEFDQHRSGFRSDSGLKILVSRWLNVLARTWLVQQHNDDNNEYADDPIDFLVERFSQIGHFEWIPKCVGCGKGLEKGKKRAIAFSV
jgi:hypothetical protein